MADKPSITVDGKSYQTKFSKPVQWEYGVNLLLIEFIVPRKEIA